MDNATIEMTAPTQDQLNQQLFKFDEDACYERDIKWAESMCHDEIEDDDDFDEDACYERDIKWAESMCHDEIEDDDDDDFDDYYEQEIEMAEYMLEINEYYENN